MTKMSSAERVTEPPHNSSPGRPRLPLDRILSTALRIVDDEGGDALTMRGLATALNTGTATLYRHFRSRADLVTQVVDRLFGEMHDDLAKREASAPADWPQEFRKLAEQMFNILSRHRGAAQLLLEAPPSGRNAMILRERCLAMLLAQGFTPQMAIRAYATLARFVLGFAIQLASQRSLAYVEHAGFGTADLSAFPATASIGDSFPVPLEEEFSFGLRLMIDGLEGIRAEEARHPT